MLVRSKTMAKALRTGTRDAVRALTIDLKMAKKWRQNEEIRSQDMYTGSQNAEGNLGAYEGGFGHQVTG